MKKQGECPPRIIGSSCHQRNVFCTFGGELTKDAREGLAGCWDGVPTHREYKNILHEASSPQALLEVVRQPGFLVMDQ